jgi:hypothetical protein
VLALYQDSQQIEARGNNLRKSAVLQKLLGGIDVFFLKIHGFASPREGFLEFLHLSQL